MSLHSVDMTVVHPSADACQIAVIWKTQLAKAQVIAHGAILEHLDLDQHVGDDSKVSTADQCQTCVEPPPLLLYVPYAPIWCLNYLLLGLVTDLLVAGGSICLNGFAADIMLLYSSQLLQDTSSRIRSSSIASSSSPASLLPALLPPCCGNTCCSCRCPAIVACDNHCVGPQL